MRSRRVLKQISSSVSHSAGCDDSKAEESGALSNRQYQLWVTLRAKGRRHNFLRALFHAVKIDCLDKFFYPFAWRWLLQLEKEFGNSHQEPNYLLDIDRL